MRKPSRTLQLKRETLRKLSARDLGRVAGGSWMLSEACASNACSYTEPVETEFCGYSTGSRYC